MSTNRITNKLNKNTSKESVNTDSFIKISLDSKNKTLPYDDINKILDISERFNYERQNSKKYRIINTINPIISNPLFNLTNPNSNNDLTLAGFNNYLFLDTSYPKDNDLLDNNDIPFITSLERNLKENNGWFGYYDPDKTKSGFCNFIDLEPTRDRFSFNTKNHENWVFFITYPHHLNKTHNMVNGGLLIIESLPVNVGGKNMVAIGLPCLHNLNVGETVSITGTNGYNGTYTVVRLGLDDGSFKEYYFVIDIEPTGATTNLSRMKRVVNGIPSDYYFRIFKKIKTVNTTEILATQNDTYKLAFSENVYNDEISQSVFTEDVDISNLVDNLGRPLSEIYITKIKTSSSGIFTKISSGIETPFIEKLRNSNTQGNAYLRTIPVINRIHNSINNTPFTTHTPLESNVNINGSFFYGDLVEYNKLDVSETVLCDVKHRFNTINRETNSNINYVSAVGASPQLTNINLGPRHEGYYYSPHIPIKIREYSNYIERGDSKSDVIPTYAQVLDNGEYLWRDLIDIGFNQSSTKTMDYPFLNGVHYLYNNETFFLKRQDPFGIWGLHYFNFPSDPYGYTPTINNNNNINSSEDVC